MARSYRPFARLLAVLLLLQVVAAPAHCLAMAAAPAGFEAVICAADGTRTVMVGPDGQEIPAHHESGGACVVCHALPQAAMTAAPDVPEPAWLAGAVAFPPATRDALPPGARAPPYRPTGPPALS